MDKRGETMFRRPGKSNDENVTFYSDEKDLSPSYPYGQHVNHPSVQSSEVPPRIFEAPTPHAAPLKPQEKSWSAHQEEPSIPHPFENQLHEESPETTLGEGVTFRGELSFERLLRIDGTFEGELLSEGKVIVGPKGRVKANLKLREAIVEGVVEGNITVEEKLELRSSARVYGDITAKILCVDEGVCIHGIVSVGEKQELSYS